MRRLRRLGLAVVGLLAAVLLAAGLLVAVAGNTDGGRRVLERIVRVATSGRVEIEGLSGTFPGRLDAGRVTLRDREGVWLVADRVSLRWRPLDLFAWRVRVDDLHAARIELTRLPAASPRPRRPSLSIPSIDVAQAAIDRLVLGAGLAGRPATLAVRGAARLRSVHELFARADAVRIDGDGRYVLRLAFDPRRVDARLSLREPAGGPIQNLLGMPDLGAVAATIAFEGPRADERVDLRIDAGALRARAQGRVNLPGRSADVAYSLDASAMSPRADLGWRSLAAHGRWRGGLADAAADGSLEVRDLRLAGAATIGDLQADLAGSAGALALRGRISRLRIGGPEPDLFASAPVGFDAAFSPSDPARGIELRVSHPLVGLKGRIEPTAPARAVLDVDVPQVAPFAAIARRSVRGRATIHADLRRLAAGMGFAIDARLTALGGPARWVAAFGERATAAVAGTADDAGIDVPTLRIAGDRWTLTASGGAARRARAARPRPGIAASIASLHAAWSLDARDLSVFAAPLAGEAKASGRFEGPPNALAGDARIVARVGVAGSTPGPLTAELHAGGVPGAGTLRVAGLLDGAPLRAALAWRRGADGGFDAVVREGDWKSARLAGEFSLDRGFAFTHARARVDVGDLADLDRLAGAGLRGAAVAEGTIESIAGHRVARLHATVRDLQVGRLAANVQIAAQGPLDRLGVQVSARTAGLGGAAASLSSAGVIDLASRDFRLTDASLAYRGQSAHLLAPAVLSFAGGLSVADLRLGTDGATLRLAGRIAPALDLQASLQGTASELVDPFAPGLVVHGRIEASASLGGRPGAPTGELHWNASGLRSADAQAMGLPDVDVRGEAQLDGDSARIDARIVAGAKSALSVEGRVPLRADGPLDLAAKGTMDLGLAAPSLEARGIYVSGAMRIDVSVAGAFAAPRLSGELRLTDGHLRDFVRGVNLENVDAQLVGDGDAFVIKSLTASMPPGQVSMTGRIGVMQAGVPLDLRIVARGARPIASGLITANLDADLHVGGTALRRLTLAGEVRVHRAVIGIPNALPPNVAVLDVRRRGRAAPATREPLVVALDLNVSAPRQILVRGRGLDAELGGDLRLGGTADTPRVDGGFDLQRGSFNLAGSRLSFTSGRVSFNGAGLRHRIDPTLDFTARTSSGGVDTTLRITGLADAPRFELTSVPSLPPDEILSALLFGGKNPTQISALQAAQIGAALATLSGVGGEDLNPLVKLQRALGLDRLTVGAAPAAGTAASPSAASGASIAAGRYLSSRVYVEAKQTTTGSSQLQVNIDLTKRLKLQTRLGNGTAITQGTTPENDPGNSIGLSYQFEY